MLLIEGGSAADLLKEDLHATCHFEVIQPRVWQLGAVERVVLFVRRSLRCCTEKQPNEVSQHLKHSNSNQGICAKDKGAEGTQEFLNI